MKNFLAKLMALIFVVGMLFGPLICDTREGVKKEERVKKELVWPSEFTRISASGYSWECTPEVLPDGYKKITCVIICDYCSGDYKAILRETPGGRRSISFTDLSYVSEFCDAALRHWPKKK